MRSYLERLVQRTAGAVTADTIQPGLRGGGTAQTADAFASGNEPDGRPPAELWPSQTAPTPAPSARPSAEVDAMRAPSSLPFEPRIKTSDMTSSTPSIARNRPEPDQAEPLPRKRANIQQPLRPERERVEPVQRLSRDRPADAPEIQQPSPSGPRERSATPERPSEAPDKSPLRPSRQPFLNSQEPPLSRPLAEALRPTPEGSRPPTVVQPLGPPLAREPFAPGVSLAEIERAVEKAVDRKADVLRRSLQPPESRAARLEPPRPSPPPPRRREEPRVIVRTERVEVGRAPRDNARPPTVTPPRPYRSPAPRTNAFRSTSKLRFGLGQM